MTESESVALPFGDSPITTTNALYPFESGMSTVKKTIIFRRDIRSRADRIRTGGMKESKSFALPLGDSPMCRISKTFPRKAYYK